jgi:hypothetical protein
MGNALDHFSILVRSCKPLQSDGYEVTLELRRTAADNSSAATVTSPAQAAQEFQARGHGGDDRAE